MAIFLCGFMGCGKTTIGKNLAKLLGCGYCDMDELIVKKAGMSIPEIFDTKGEKHFRTMESDLIIELGSFKGIVSCGGGAMLNEQNGKNAAENGTHLLKHAINVLQEIPTDRSPQAVPKNSLKSFTMNDIRGILKMQECV